MQDTKADTFSLPGMGVAPRYQEREYIRNLSVSGSSMSLRDELSARAAVITASGCRRLISRGWAPGARESSSSRKTAEKSAGVLGIPLKAG
jgi:hypothetical protein